MVSHCTHFLFVKHKFMKANQLATITAAALLMTSLAFGQGQPKTDSLKTRDSQRMNTLFSGVKNPIKKIKYLGLSVGTGVQYGALAGQLTPLVGMQGMLHLNKKWGIGLAGYGTAERNFAPTSLNAARALSLHVGYGGLQLEYTPRPDAAVHVSFPLLIGGGVARVDSVGSRSNRNRNDDNDRNERNNQRDGFRNGTGFFVVQPGINLEANLFRFAKIYGGISYRIVPTTDPSNATTTLPVPSASQLGGIGFNAGLRVGLFDYRLERAKKNRKARR